jgi:isopenicillin-N N-acyltransferase-like protein
LKKIIGIFFCTLFISTIIPVGINATDTHNTIDGGWLEEHDGIKILHISGSSYEMGYQYGFLLKEEILENSRAVISFLEQVGFFYNDLLDVWNVMKDYVPMDIIKEMNGMANGSGISFEQISAINMLGPIYHDITCCGSTAWGPATSDGSLYHMRSYDASLNIRDPISGKYLQENQILIVRKPNNG